MDSEESQNNQLDSLESLETPSPQIEHSVSATNETPSSDLPPQDNDSPPPKKPNLLRRFNIYVIIFLLILAVALAIILYGYFSVRQQSPATLSNQTLSENALKQLSQSDSTLGSPSQILNIKSSTAFDGNVLIHKDLDVAGNLDLGGTLALNDLTASNTAQVGQLNVINNFSDKGNAAIQGGLTVAQSLQVNGSANFGGNVSAPQLNINTLNLNGDLNINRHIVTNGSLPSKTDGSSLGSGGSSSLSGSDSAGTISVNTGSNPSAGCFLTVNFASKYASTPHVVITPIGPTAGGLSYYINLNSSSFSVCDAANPPADSSFGFDYIVID